MSQVCKTAWEGGAYLNPRTREAEAGTVLLRSDQPGLHNQFQESQSYIIEKPDLKKTGVGVGDWTEEVTQLVECLLMLQEA